MISPTIRCKHLESDQIEHFELALGSRSRVLSEVVLNELKRVTELRRNIPPSTTTESEIVADDDDTESTTDQPKFMRLCSDAFPDLKGDQLKTLSEVCLAAHHSADFFLCFAGNQWVRTAIKSKKCHEELFPPGKLTEEDLRELIAGITIHSNVLPCDPYWEKLRAVRDAAAPSNSRKVLHFPCRIIEEAEQEGKGLIHKMLEWKHTSQECVIKSIVSELPGGNNNIINTDQKFLWEIPTQDVRLIKEIYISSDDGSGISLVTWRGGMFVRKNRRGYYCNILDQELDVMERFSHPHIIYGFGVSSPDDKKNSTATSRIRSGDPSTSSSSTVTHHEVIDDVQERRPDLFMEFMQIDLQALIIDRSRGWDELELRPPFSHDDVIQDRPPFSHADAVDILLQVAEAVAHLQHENVVHCDIKSANIFISEFVILETVKYYVVKVADFGSAQFVDINHYSRISTVNSGSTMSRDDSFHPGGGTNNYAAPEVLRWRKNRNVAFPEPHKVDVYSFGIVAFEVLTGEKLYEGMDWREVQRLVIDDKLTPPLREWCQKPNYLYDEELISLIEKCWRDEPSERPFFSEICEVLTQVKERIILMQP